MHTGKGTKNKGSSSVYTASEIETFPLRASRMGDTTSAAPPISPTVPLSWLQKDENDYDDAMAEISVEISRLDDEEKKLAKREKLERKT